MRDTLFCYLLAVGLTFLSLDSLAEEQADVIPLIEAANQFLESLELEQVQIAQIDFKTDARESWHYIPKKRKGLAWREMNKNQKALSWALFQVALSQSGQAKALGVIAAETILWKRANYSDFRDPRKYHVTIFGHPKLGGTWGASLEGHHLSVNLTIIEGREVTVTPSFFGANPDHVKEGAQKGLRPLKAEAEEALKLLNMLDEKQLKLCVLSHKVPKDIFSKAARRFSALPQQGLPVGEMNELQKLQVNKILFEYLGRYHTPYAYDDWQQIQIAGIDLVYFAWIGSKKSGERMYYRIQGPTFIMEYINVQNGGNHSHTVWRNFKNDFGRDLLKEHLEEFH